ncbi:AAA family ATPase [Sinorhizobium medicae]|nr:AAA family ATPase [Sinorhizobium medicae]
MAKIDFKVPPISQERAPIDVARSYIAIGAPVFPCRESVQWGEDPSTGEWIEWQEKSPYTPNGLKGATTSSRIVGIWFGERYPGALIGLPTGEPLGAWVLDLDRHGDRDGHAWLADMEAKHGALPETARASTANGGTHIFFKHVAGIRNRAAIAPGVDTRGDGGYVCGPGSQMADGRRYQWIDYDGDGLPPIADAPAWLIDLLKPKVAENIERRQPSTYTYQPEDSGAARYAAKSFEMELEKLRNSPSGQRGQQLFASACSIGEFVAGGLISRSEAEAGLMDAAAACGVLQKDGERKTVDRIRRGLDKTANTPRQIPEREYDNDNTPVNAAEMEAFVERHKAKKEAAAQQQAAAVEGQPPADQAPTPRQKARFELTWFDDIEEGKPKETILKGWLGVGEFTTISGLPGTGKSVVTTDLACHIAAGMDWHGMKVQQGLVVYVAAERKKLTERRMMAFRKHHNKHNVPLLVVGGMLDFTRDLKDAEDIIKVIREAETITGMKCVWVIIDTLTRTFGAGDQNASKDMVKFVRSCDKIVEDIGAHVTAIHHSSWNGERGKGAIDLDGAVDASFMVKKDGNKHRLVCDGTNDGEDGDVLAFTMQSVEIGVNEDGEPTTAPVVVPAASGDGRPLSSGTLKGYKGDVLKALHAAIEKSGIEPTGHAFPEDILVVDEQTWRTEYYAMRDTSTTSGAETARKQFQRAPAALVQDGHVNNIGLWYWPA